MGGGSSVEVIWETGIYGVLVILGWAGDVVLCCVVLRE